nr:hypothetical protein [Tanacetum cinerariifolium]
MKEVTSGSGTVASNGGSSIVDIKDLVAEDNDSRRHKGKGISCHFPSEEANAGSSHLSQRYHIKHLVDSAKTSSRMCYQPNENESSINTQTESSTSRNRGKRPISCIEDSVGQPSTITSKRKQRDIKQQNIEMGQRNHNNGIEIIDLVDSPIASSRVRDIPDAEELGIDRQPESSTSRNRGKRPISCIEDSVGLSWETSRSKRSKNLTRPRLKQNMILSGQSTSNPVSEPNVQIPAAAEGDMVRNDLLQVDREFNENNYKMLLALDEDNYKHQ